MEIEGGNRNMKEGKTRLLEIRHDKGRWRLTRHPRKGKTESIDVDAVRRMNCSKCGDIGNVSA